MDFTITIIGIAFFLLAVLPILMTVHSRNRKSKRLKRTFSDLGTRNNLQLEERGVWNDRIIGIDPESSKIVYISPQIPEGTIIDLNRVTNFKIIRTTEDNKVVSQKERAAHIGLLFSFKGTGLQDIYLPFFDVDFDDPLQMNYHSNLASTWYHLIEKHSKVKSVY